MESIKGWLVVAPVGRFWYCKVTCCSAPCTAAALKSWWLGSRREADIFTRLSSILLFVENGFKDHNDDYQNIVDDDDKGKRMLVRRHLWGHRGARCGAALLDIRQRPLYHDHHHCTINVVFIAKLSGSQIRSWVALYLLVGCSVGCPSVRIGDISTYLNCMMF